MDTPGDHITNTWRLNYGLMEDPRNYYNPEGQTWGGPTKEEQDG